MTTYNSTQVSLFMFGGFDILGTRTKLDYDTSAPLENKTVMGAAWETFADTGLRTAKFSQDGYYDDAAGSANAALVGLAGTAQVGCLSIEGGAVGKNFLGFSGLLQSSYKRSPAVGKLHRAAADHTATGIVEDRGVILFAEGAAASATANGTGQNNTASSALGGAGYLQCSSLTLGGYTNLACKVQDSADNTTFADLVTFTVLTTAPNAQRVALASNATVRQYIRSQYTYNGAGAAQTANIFIGFKRN